ncbi:NAD(P)H-dependent oxidoreductase [Halarcobacter sp.]|uniref:NAD(P)H-dependent oxidoreductase n=1 Tax=Halarcobacter sp. TaxID=2321133 RepID=UPI002AA628A0|nr:NAD(P)H-dependent oxidoreductase [Halarcobacter sp.]
MKNILLILAHPNEESLNHYIASLIKDEMSKKNYVEYIDLYKSDYQQGFYKLENENTKERIYFQDKITKADEIIFVFPYWWGSIPAILKNWLDWNFSTNFAYSYENSKPKGLLKNKKVTVFTTTGAPKFYYDLTGANRRLKNMWKEQIINFCGMELSSFNIFGGIDTKIKNINKIKNRVINIVNT